ncbi:MAG TPA: penicillin-binding transpeptidase domain-containing protein [Candidatus Paceibacterota bacterium]|nr:penicillin-binding transpeptidase domain-containing protein [Candidatus Paceibacterota bacterium]
MRINNRFNKDIEPDEIFLDSTNLSSLNTQQFEGWIEKPISKRVITLTFIFFAAVVCIFSWKVWSLQIKNGESLAKRSERNSLKKVSFPPERGIIYDRNGKMVAWNDKDARSYYAEPGLYSILGYLGYPTKKDLETVENPKERLGREGVEKIFNEILRGQDGVKMVEVDALGEVQSESVYNPGVKGGDIYLSLDAEMSSVWYKAIRDLAADKGFQGGAGIMMDIKTGEVIAMTSFPEYDSNAIVRKDEAKINEYLKDKRMPFLNRVTLGLYTPGSVMKPIFALGALNENIIDPKKEIYSAGFISIPNPYFPDKPTIFKDWKAHGWVDMQRAIAVSSDVYFYEIGGGYEGQKGLGISNLEKYARMFGIGTTTGFDIGPEENGNIPSPAWKAENFDGEKWSIGNTYHSSIGQYGFQVTPIQMVRAIAAIANDGHLVVPTILKASNSDWGRVSSVIDIDKNKFDIVKEGMRRSVTEGTSMGISFPKPRIASKTGTAELGALKQYVNAWNVGFFPYESPKYAFAVVMERGPVKNTVGGVYIMNQLFNWMIIHRPEYVSPTTSEIINP